jgi:hypothetical protein
MPDTHPSVIYINAITSTPQVSERRCYPDEAAAFADMCAYEPFNNTMLSPSRCDQVHCPHGCVQGGVRTRPVLQEPVMSDPAGRPADARRWRCPKCHTEYTPGETPAVTANRLIAILAAAGLEDVGAGQYGAWPVVVSGVFPPGNRDAAGWIVRVAEQQDRAEGSTADGLTEPYWMGLFEPSAAGWVTTPVAQWARLTLPQIREMIRGYMGT